MTYDLPSAHMHKVILSGDPVKTPQYRGAFELVYLKMPCLGVSILHSMKKVD